MWPGATKQIKIIETEEHILQGCPSFEQKHECMPSEITSLENKLEVMKVEL